MSHSRFININNTQNITITKYNQYKNIEICIEDKSYFKDKIYHVFICKEEMKAVSILFENNYLNNIDNFFNYLYDTFSNKLKDSFYELFMYNAIQQIPHFYVGVKILNENKYSFNREKYKFKLKEKTT